MKLNFKSIFLSVAALFLISCSQQNKIQTEKTSVSLKLPVLKAETTAGTSETVPDYSTLVFKVKLSGVDEEIADVLMEKTASAGTTVVFDELTAGNYLIEVEAFFPAYKEASFAGKSNVEIVAGQAVNVTIELEATGYKPEEPSDTITDEVLEEYTELAFTLDKGDNSVGRKPRYRATIDIDKELEKKNITLEAGDTVVITLTGITSADLNELTTQLVQKDAEGNYENFTDTYGRYTQISFKAESEINLKAPLNFITIPEGCTGYNAVQFYYDAQSENSPETGAVISGAEVTLCVYPAESRTLEFGKSYGYDANGNEDTSIYRDDIILALAAEDKLNQLTEANNLKYGDKVSVTVSGTSSKDVELFCYLVDGSEQANWYKSLNTNQPALKLEKGKAFEETIVFDVTQPASGTGRFKVQFFNDSSKTATEDGNVAVQAEEVTLTSKMTITNFHFETKGINLTETE